MRRVGRAPGELQSFNTCAHGGRVLHFSRGGERLAVTEVLLGEGVGLAAVETAVRCGPGAPLACCSLGPRVLVMGERGGGAFAALVAVGSGGPGLAAGLQAAELEVLGPAAGDWPGWQDRPCLSRAAEGRALLYFCGRREAWLCEVQGGALRAVGLGPALPTQYGFATVPVPLADGELLVPGALPLSRDVVLLRVGDSLAFWRAGAVPGRKRCWASAVLVAGRFLVGFGGFNGVYLNDLWVLDAQTARASPVRREGDWHPGGGLVFLTVRAGALYLAGGMRASAVNCLPLPALARLIRCGRVGNAFRRAVGLAPAALCAHDQEGLASLLPWRL